MNKIFILALSLCAIHLNIFAATYNCNVQEISAFSWKVSNEFLFPTYADYKDSNGRAYVCGHRGADGCDSGTFVVVTGEHYFTNDRKNNVGVYRCSTGGANAWAEIDISSLPMCGSTSGKTLITSLQDVEVYGPDSKFVRNGSRVLHAASPDICIAEKKAATPAPTPAPNPTPTPNPKTCRETRSTAIGKACCDTGNMGRYDDKTDQCICIDGFEFKINNGKGVCVPKVQQTEPGVPYTCPPEAIAQASKIILDPNAPANVKQAASQLIAACNSATPNQAQIAIYITIIYGYVQTEPSAPQPGNVSAEITITQNTVKASQERISSASSGLRKLKTSIESDYTVWKDEDGNFNTARLASDSIAAVVLGTAGGLITSNVVKKSQVKNGFEDIKCTIGGQTVSSWGDEFSVGVR